MYVYWLFRVNCWDITCLGPPKISSMLQPTDFPVLLNFWLSAYVSISLRFSYIPFSVPLYFIISLFWLDNCTNLTSVKWPPNPPSLVMQINKAHIKPKYNINCHRSLPICTLDLTESHHKSINEKSLDW